MSNTIFGTIATPNQPFGSRQGDGRENREDSQCFLKITVKLSGYSSEHAPGGDPNAANTILQINRGTVESECVCLPYNALRENGEVEDFGGPTNEDSGTGVPQSGPGVGGRFDYKRIIWYLKCGGAPCDPMQWEEEYEGPECPCITQPCGPLDFYPPPIKYPVDIAASITQQGMRRALSNDVRQQLNNLKGTCVWQSCE